MASHAAHNARSAQWLAEPRKTRARRVSPLFQPAPLVLAALQHSAKSGQIERHKSLLVPCMGTLLVADVQTAQKVYRDALSMAWGARSLDGLESIVLSGMQTALSVG